MSGTLNVRLGCTGQDPTVYYEKRGNLWHGECMHSTECLLVLLCLGLPEGSKRVVILLCLGHLEGSKLVVILLCLGLPEGSKLVVILLCLGHLEGL